MNNRDLLISIKDTTEETAKDMAEVKAEAARLRQEVDDLKLARARLDGQIDMLWKLVSLVGIAGIAALIKAFMH